MRIVNLTPHEVVVAPDGVTPVAVFEPSGRVARVAEIVEPDDPIPGYESVPVVQKGFGQIEGLPDPEDGTLYLVSLVVLQAAKAAGRTDCIAPDTGPDSAIRDEAGRIKAVRRLMR